MFLATALAVLTIFFLSTALAAFAEGNRQEGSRQAGKAFLAGIGALLCVVSAFLDTMYDD